MTLKTIAKLAVALDLEVERLKFHPKKENPAE